MSNQILTTVTDATDTQKGVSLKGSGTFTPIPLVTFNTDITLQPNHAHALVSEELIDITVCELPSRNTFHRNDIIECEDVSGYNFKIIVSGDT